MNQFRQQNPFMQSPWFGAWVGEGRLVFDRVISFFEFCGFPPIAR
jgi:hypothetical protein